VLSSAFPACAIARDEKLSKMTTAMADPAITLRIFNHPLAARRTLSHAILRKPHTVLVADSVVCILFLQYFS
jgi:hypothetical protein